MINNFLKLLAINGLSLYAIYILLKRQRNKKVYNGLIEMIGDTPLIYIKSLSKLTNCHIYVKYTIYRLNVNL